MNLFAYVCVAFYQQRPELRLVCDPFAVSLCLTPPELRCSVTSHCPCLSVSLPQQSSKSTFLILKVCTGLPVMSHIYVCFIHSVAGPFSMTEFKAKHIKHHVCGVAGSSMT